MLIYTNIEVRRSHSASHVVQRISAKTLKINCFSSQEGTFHYNISNPVN